MSNIAVDAKKTKIESIVEGQLRKIEEAYPKSRIESIKTRMMRFWDCEPGMDRIPYAIWDGAPKNVPELPDGTSENDRELVNQLQYIIEHAEWDDDFFPALSPGVRQVTIPSYFGCVEETASASVRVKPAIGSPETVYSLPDIGFGPETPGGEMLLRMKYWRKATHGLLPLYEADMQGPFSVASQIWGIENFLIAIYDNPDEVNHLISRCTDAIILYYRLMYEAAEGDIIPLHCMPAFWYPCEKGIAVSEDLVAVVSPSIVRDFVRPYLERIAGAFGGVFMHSCGSINNVVCELNKVKGLVGLNFSSCETDLDKAAAEIDKSLFILSHNSPVNRIDLPLLDPIRHAETCRQVFLKHDIHGACLLIPSTMDLHANEHSQVITKSLRRQLDNG